MADYRRFIAYIYEYTNGRKNRNTGFAKVESRNGICRILVRLQAGNIKEDWLNLYGFVRTGEWLLGIFLGKMTGDSGEIRVTTHAEHIGNSGYGLEKLTGLWLEGSNGKNYLTVFDEEMVDVEKLVKEIPKPPEEIHKEEEEEPEVPEKIDSKPDVGEKDPIAEIEAEEISSLSEEEEVEKPKVSERAEEINPVLREEEEAEKPEVSERAEEINPMLREEEEVEKSKVPEEEEMDPVLREEEKKTDQKLPASETKNMRDTRGAITSEERKIKIQSAEIPPREASCQQPITRCAKQFQCPAGPEKRWECMSRRYPHFQPFGEGEDCLRISPKDLGMFQQGSWRMGNNSFLVHGYYSYRHLLFGRMKDGSYLLGVPGIYEKQELFMAQMFGFPNFRHTNNSEHPKEFGYWCRTIL